MYFPSNNKKIDKYLYENDKNVIYNIYNECCNK